jgi:integrase
MRAIDCTTARIEDFKAKRSAMARAVARNGGTGGTLIRRTTINNELRALGTMLTWARESGYRVALPKIKRLRPDAARVTAWTAAELDRLFAAARATSPTLLSMLIVLVNTGMRCGELLAMEWSWVDLDAEYIRIPCSAEWGPKSRKAREVPIGPAVRAVLSPLQRDEGPVFVRPTGERYAGWPKDWWLPARTAAKLRGGVHQTRHTFASHFLAKVADLFLLSKVLGHSHGRTTELYAHMMPDYLERARGAVALTPTLRTMATTMAVDKMAHRKRCKSG